MTYFDPLLFDLYVHTSQKEMRELDLDYNVSVRIHLCTTTQVLIGRGVGLDREREKRVLFKNEREGDNQLVLCMGVCENDPLIYCKDSAKLRG